MKAVFLVFWVVVAQYAFIWILEFFDAEIGIKESIVIMAGILILYVKLEAENTRAAIQDAKNQIFMALENTRPNRYLDSE